MEPKDYMYKELTLTQNIINLFELCFLAVCNCALNVFWFSQTLPSPLLHVFWFSLLSTNPLRTPSKPSTTPTCKAFFYDMAYDVVSMINCSKEPLDIIVVHNPCPNKYSTPHCSHPISKELHVHTIVIGTPHLSLAMTWHLTAFFGWMFDRHHMCPSLVSSADSTLTIPRYVIASAKLHFPSHVSSFIRSTLVSVFLFKLTPTLHPLFCLFVGCVQTNTDCCKRHLIH